MNTDYRTDRRQVVTEGRAAQEKLREMGLTSPMKVYLYRLEQKKLAAYTAYAEAATAVPYNHEAAQKAFHTSVAADNAYVTALGKQVKNLLK